MPFALPSLRDALPPTKSPISPSIFVSHLIPPIACYMVAAVLAVTPHSRVLRATLWPVLAWLAFRAAASVDMSFGIPVNEVYNGELTRYMIFICLQALPWAFATGPLVRHLRPANSSPSTIMDALDLALSARGHGWDWSRGLHVARETRPTGRIPFVLCALASVVVHGFAGVSLYRAVHTFTGLGPKPSSIFDATLPLTVRYLRASVISTLAAMTTYCNIQAEYDLFAVVGILVFGQDVAQWPPPFDHPWCATSLSDLWSRRWHQLHRKTFLMGAYPLSVVFGRVGWIVGAFLASALFHLLMMSTFVDWWEAPRMLFGFGMMAPGILAERAYYKATGRKVGGVVGWIWTMTWLLLWGNVIIDGFVMAGMFAAPITVDAQSPLREYTERWVSGFDAWLHTL